MNAPSIRTVAVATAFLGLSLVVAGAATAMTAQPSDEPVATAVTIEQGPANDASLQSSADEAPPATAVEVPAAPIECTPEGVCGVQPPQTSTVANDVSASETEPAAATSASHASAPESCDLPVRPERPEHGDRRAWERSVRAWAEDLAAAAQDCGLETADWRREMAEASWEEHRSRWSGHDHGRHHASRGWDSHRLSDRAWSHRER
ncbi:hypothetical protein [Demequina activiva]|nr:hypothetical protein [Demequina activiva]